MESIPNEFGKYEVYTQFGSRYCYRDSHVLRNKLGIRDAQTLRAIETDLYVNKQTYLLEFPLVGRFTATHLCKIHRFLFEDIYPFAGRYRLETIKKGETTFLNEKEISGKLTTVLADLRKEKNLSDLSHPDFIARLAYYLAEVNYIHPFREGNGRATREFFRLLIEHNGFTVHWTAAGVTALLDAMTESVYDTGKLCSVLETCIIASN